MPDCKLTTDGPLLDETQGFNKNNSHHGTRKKLDKSSRARHNFRKHVLWSLEEKNLLMQFKEGTKAFLVRCDKGILRAVWGEKFGLNSSLLIYVSQGYIYIYSPCSGVNKPPSAYK